MSGLRSKFNESERGASTAGAVFDGFVHVAWLGIFNVVNQMMGSQAPVWCSVCGGREFQHRAILWDLLVKQWQLSAAERLYIDQQQGTTCIQCGANLRSIALSDAIRTAFATESTLREFVQEPHAKGLATLEINEAGNLSPVLQHLPGHVLAAYPAVDIHHLPYGDGQFDLVIHSDTLEHVRNPIHALTECRRVLRPGGSLCFTVPAVLGRMSRDRAGLEKSFHGDARTLSDDFAVQTEYGCDMWTQVIEAGFSAVTIHSVGYPAGLAMSARKN